MRWIAWMLLVGLVSCGGNDAKPDGPTPTKDELEANELAFFEIMESNDHHNERLLELIDDKKPVAEIMARLDKIEKGMKRTRDLRVHADANEEKKLDDEFNRFLSDLAESRKKDWANDAKALWKNMQNWCTRCHDLFEEDD